MGKKVSRMMKYVLFLCWLRSCSAIVYTVGDSSGWDISTDLDSWSNDKTFSTADTLLFQYSQYHSVSEVSEENYKGCNTTNVLQSSSNGNTSFPLTTPGEIYFVCGNRLHCLGGMKLHIHVVQNQTTTLSPAGAPEAGGSLPPGSSKTNNPSSAGASLFSQARVEVLHILPILASFLIFFS